MRILGSAVLTILFVASGAISAPAANFISSELGTAENFAILGGPNATDIHENGPGTTVGNVGISAGTYSLDNPSFVQGNLLLGSTATVSHPGQVLGSILTNQDSVLSTAFSSASSASTTFAGLTPTVTNIPTSITSSETINATPNANDVTVVDLSSINLGGNNTLTLNGNGDPNAQFVLNVDGDIRLNSGRILLTGGLTSQNVVINLEGSHSVSTSGGGFSSELDGILLATDPNSSLQFSPALIRGALISDAGHWQMASGTHVVSPVPEPTSLGLVAAVGIGVVGRCLLRRRRHA